ncbi:MAG: DUF4870 domain-containing protein [Waterburya sp.]
MSISAFGGKMQTESSSDKKQLLSALAHGSVFISALVLSIGIPIAILSVSEDSIIKDNAKEAINFHLNVWLIGGIITVLSFLSFGLAGFILGPIWLLIHWGLSIWAVIQCLQTPDQVFRYPFIFRVV